MGILSKQGRKYLIFILLVSLTLIVNQSFLKEVQTNISGSMIKPQNEDYLHYQFTVIDVYGQAQYGTFNLSFYNPPFFVTISDVQHEITDAYFPDVFKCVGESSDYTLMWGYPPDFEFWCMANHTDRSSFWYYDTDLYGNWPKYFPWLIPTNVSIGSSVLWKYDFLEIDGTENYTLNGVQYPAWVAHESIDSLLFNTYRFDKISGILLSENNTFTYGETRTYLFNLTEAKIGDVCIPRKPTTITCSAFQDNGVLVEGSLKSNNSPLSGKPVTIYCEWPNGSRKSFTTTTKHDGSFSQDPFTGLSFWDPGDYHVLAYFGGDTMFEWSQSQETGFTVEPWVPDEPESPFIPGFPLESIIIGFLTGVAFLAFLKRRQLRVPIPK